DALLVGVRGRAAAVGQQAVIREAEQLAALLLGVGDAAAQVAGAELGTPVLLAQLVDIQGHQEYPGRDEVTRMCRPLSVQRARFSHRCRRLSRLAGRLALVQGRRAAAPDGGVPR